MKQLSKNFTLEELTKSKAMDAYNRMSATERITNNPNKEQLENLTHLCVHYLQPLRDKYGPVFINSGFRSPRVNTIVKGASNSYHLQGLAADIRLHSWMEAYQFAGFFIQRFNDEGMGYHELIISYNVKTKGLWLHLAVPKQGELNTAKLKCQMINYCR